MKAHPLTLLMVVVLFALQACRSNTEGIMESKISKVDKRITNYNPYKTTKRKSVSAKDTQDVSKEEAQEGIWEQSNQMDSEENSWNDLSDEEALKEILSKLSEPKQFFYFKQERDTVLMCSKGSVIYIEANSFSSFSNQPISKLIRFEVTEYIEQYSYLTSNISTTTNKGDFLQSSGVLLLKAYSGREELRISENKVIRFQLPGNEKCKGVNLYSGVRNVNSVMEWYVMDKNNSLKKSESKTEGITEYKEGGEAMTGEPGKNGTMHFKPVNSKRENTNLFKRISSKINRKKDYSEREVENSTFALSKLGWIQVGSAFHLRGPKTKFVIEDEHIKNSRVSLIIKNHNLVLPGFSENGKISFKHVPLGEEILLVAIKVEKGSILLYTKNINTERGKFEEPIEFSEVSFLDLQDEIKKRCNRQ